MVSRVLLVSHAATQPRTRVPAAAMSVCLRPPHRKAARRAFPDPPSQVLEAQALAPPVPREPAAFRRRLQLLHLSSVAQHEATRQAPSLQRRSPSSTRALQIPRHARVTREDPCLSAVDRCATLESPRAPSASRRVHLPSRARVAPRYRGRSRAPRL